MLGGADIASGQRLRVTLEIDESHKDEVFRALQETQAACKIVSVRRIQSGNARKRFAVPSDEEPLRPSPVHPLLRRNEEAVAICDDNQSIGAAPLQDPELATCDFCLRAPCITTSAFKPKGRCDARVTNHTKGRKDYKWYWKTLKDNGLLENPTYLEKKQQLGCLIDDVREVMLR